MRLWIAHVPDPDAPWTPALAANGEPVKTFAMRASEGELYRCEVEILNQGLALLSPSRPKYAVIAYSPTNLPADGIPLARGVFEGVPNSFSPSGGTVTMRIKCAPADVDDRLKAFAQARVDEGGVWADDVFPDFEDPKAHALAARGAALHVDPLTHEISLTDAVHGDRVVDLGAAADGAVTIELADGEVPARKVRLKVVAEWTQEASGWCDIAPSLAYGGDITTLDGGSLQFAGRDQPAFSGSIDYGTSTGWQADKSLIAYVRESTQTFPSGAVYDSTYEDYLVTEKEYSRLQVGDQTQVQYALMKDRLPKVQVADREMVKMTKHRYSYLYNHVQYSYSQPRREELLIELDYGVQGVGTAVDVVEMEEISLTDLVMPKGLTVWAPGTAYAVGDKVLFSGATWRCLKDHVSTDLFYTIGPSRRVGLKVVFPELHPEWVAIPSPAAIPDRRQPTFFDTPRGQRVAEHAVMRAYAFGRSRARYLRVKARFKWTPATVGVRLMDEARLLVRGAGGTLQPLRGKVVDIGWAWASNAATVELTVAVSLGDGRNEAAAWLAGYVTGYVDGYVARRRARDLASWTVVPGPLTLPVDAYRLGLADYAVARVERDNEAPVQTNKAAWAAAWGKDPQRVVDETPTKVRVTMRALDQYDTLVRTYAAPARALRCVRGADLVNGGEP